MSTKLKNPNKKLLPKRQLLHDTSHPTRGRVIAKTEKMGHVINKRNASENTVKVSNKQKSLDSTTRNCSKEIVSVNQPSHEPNNTVQELINRIESLSEQQSRDYNYNAVMSEEKATPQSNRKKSDKYVSTDNLSDTDTDTLCPHHRSVNELIKQIVEKNVRLQVLVDEMIQAREREKYELAWEKYMINVKNWYSQQPLDTSDLLADPSNFSKFYCSSPYPQDVPKNPNNMKLKPFRKALVKCNRCFATFPFYFDQASLAEDLRRDEEKLTDGLDSYSNSTRETSTQQTLLRDNTIQCLMDPVNEAQIDNSCDCFGNKPSDGTSDCTCDDKKLQTSVNCGCNVTEVNFSNECHLAQDNATDTVSLKIKNTNKNVDVRCSPNDFSIVRKCPQKENFTQCNSNCEKHQHSGLCHKSNIRRLDKIESKLDLLLKNIDNMIIDMKKHSRMPIQQGLPYVRNGKPNCERQFNSLPAFQRGREGDHLSCGAELKLDSALKEIEEIFANDEDTERSNNKNSKPFEKNNTNCEIVCRTKVKPESPFSIENVEDELNTVFTIESDSNKEPCTDYSFEPLSGLDYDPLLEKKLNKQCCTHVDFLELQCKCNSCSNKRCVVKSYAWDKSKGKDFPRFNYFDKRKNANVGTTGLKRKANNLNDDIRLVELVSEKEQNPPNGKPRSKEVPLKIVDSLDLIPHNNTGIKEKKIVNRLSNITSCPFKYNLDELKKSVECLVTSKEKEISQLLCKQSIREDSEFCFDIPTRDVSTVITSSLSKTQFDAKFYREDKYCSVARLPISSGINTDELSFPTLLGISRSSVKRVLPNLKLEQFLSRQLLQMLTYRDCLAPYERKFICSICGETFHSATDLCRHINSHSLCLDKMCKICHLKVDNTSDVLAVFTCQYCGKKFARAYCCEWHEQNCSKRPDLKQDIQA